MNNSDTSTTSTSSLSPPVPVLKSLPPEIPKRFSGVFQQAANSWAANGILPVLKLLSGGKSGASVTIVDVQPSLTSSAGHNPIQPGHYVLKLDDLRTWTIMGPKGPAPAEPDESQRHIAAQQMSPDFASKHIPSLARHLIYNSDRDYVALLYDIAGSSYSDVVAATDLATGPLTKCCKSISKDLLIQLNHDLTVSTMTAAAALSNWLGYRLDPTLAPSLHTFIQSLTNNGTAFPLAGEVLINPLWFCGSEFTMSTHSLFSGHIHGDLHPGNVLLRHEDAEIRQYWLIDFALFRHAPLFYDHAYIEFALLKSSLDGLGIERMYGLLRALEAPPKSAAAENVPSPDLGVLCATRQLRHSADEWQRAKQTKRLDSYTAQQLLARVAVGLNWANKPISDHGRTLALAYSGWAARHFMQRFERNAISKCLEGVRYTLPHASPTEAFEPDIVQDKDSTVMWQRVWAEMGKFDEVNGRFILVAGNLGNADIASLGLLPWAAVIDLDPTSDTSGLFSKASVPLKKLRLVTQLSRRDSESKDLSVQIDRTTTWFMAAGWPSRYEPIPTDDVWRRAYVPQIRRLLAAIRRTTVPDVVKVLVIPGTGVSQQRLELVLSAIDEVFQDPGNVILLSDHMTSSLAGTRFELNPRSFIHGVRRTFGVQDDAQDPDLPGIRGPVTISLEQLRDIQADLEVLHSRILSESAAQPRDRDAFWQGSQPTWADLHAGLDAPRIVQPELQRELESLLGAGKNRTIEFHHMPGAGGTTVALRCAWNLRLHSPVLVLRQYTRLTADRVAQIFHLTQKPVLVVADASVIPVANREDLYRELAGRHVRAVILYVVRTIQPSKRLHSLNDPMSSKEAATFLALYSSRIKEPSRKGMLAQITNNPLESQYRSAFFYGLITYDREFRKVESYVEAHLADVPTETRRVVQYLALVTKYSQVGLNEAIIRHLCGYKAGARCDFSHTFGTAATLIQHRGRVIRLMHPLIAEHVLASGVTGGSHAWKARLKDLSLGFISDVVNATGNDSRAAREVCVHLFIRRDAWAPRGSRQFAELLNDIPTPAGRHEVLDLLANTFPDEAHFWNHLGRHQIYEMRSDYARAEEYLKRAVELSPDDSLHLHALGMVRRLWIEKELDKLFASRGSVPNAESVLAAIKSLAETAGEAFTAARKLRPADEHGYVTHIQLVAEISQRLLQSSNLRNAGGLQAASGTVAEWLQKNLVLANDLLDHIRENRPEIDAPDASNYHYLECERNVAEVLGGLDSLIKNWELLVSKGSATPELRRALTTVYVRRCGKIWGTLSISDLRRIAEHSEAVLHSEPDSTRDVLTWFQAYRRLPEFNPVRALDVLGSCSAHTKAVDIWYYLWILHFVLWRQNVEMDEIQVKNALDSMKAAGGVRRDYSFEWFGKEPQWFPVVHYRDIREWQPTSDQPNPALEYVTGTIDSIDGPQSGKVRLGTQTVAFFNPGTRFHPTNDINRQVRFYLGFSYEGLRAWHVEPAV